MSNRTLTLSRPTRTTLRYRALDRAIAEAALPCQALPDGATVETGDSHYEPDAQVNRGFKKRRLFSF